eukprot:TRINITY_DN1277_c0_g1_i7.p1 TRINITY_DN1277_c0_g1~~TRINITY_DN1277_c0_g1_i7.p1  ORF type:complete len:139 (-),score=47.82 TRINITY_DN1277_c0_g1_i7:6-422(-)
MCIRDRYQRRVHGDKLIDQQMLDVLKDANNLLEEMEQAGTFEQLEEVILDLKEKEQKQQQIDDMLNKYGLGTDNASVEDEYNRIEASLVQEQLHDIQTDFRHDKQQNQQQVQQKQVKQQQQKQQDSDEDETVKQLNAL